MNNEAPKMPTMVQKTPHQTLMINIVEGKKKPKTHTLAMIIDIVE